MLKTIRLFYNYIFNHNAMFNKKTLLLAAGYVFGSVVSSLYSKKKPADLKKDIQKSKKEGE